MQSKPLSHPPPPPPEVTNYLLELNKVRKQLFPLWREILSLKISIFESLRRGKLREFEMRHNKLASMCVDLRQKVIYVTDLVDKNDPGASQRIATIMMDWWDQLKIHEDTLSRTISDVTDTLRSKTAEADFKRTLFISVSAILIAVVSIIVNVFA